MGIFSDFGTPAWSRWYRYVNSLFGEVAADRKVFVLPTASTAAWDLANKPLRLYEQYRWGDWMPPLSWSYTENASKTVSTGYLYFIRDALLKRLQNSAASDEQKVAVKNTDDELQMYRAELRAKEDEGDRAYREYFDETPASMRLSRKDYFDKFGYTDEIAAVRLRLAASAKTLTVLTQHVGDPDLLLLNDALVAYDNPNQRIRLPYAKEMINQPDLWQEYMSTRIGNDIDTFLKETDLRTQSIEEQALSSSTFDSSWSASVSVNFLGLFRGGGANAEQQEQERHVRENTTRIRTSFANLKTFPIIRGQWFNGNVLDRFSSIVDRGPVFGPNGQLEVVPESALVGRGMRVEIFADEKSLDYYYKRFHAGADAGFWVGWWKIGGSAEYTTTKSETKCTKYQDRIEFVDLTGRGKVLAVLGKHAAAGLPKALAVNGLVDRRPDDDIARKASEQVRAWAKKKLGPEWFDPETGIEPRV